MCFFLLANQAIFRCLMIRQMTIYEEKQIYYKGIPIFEVILFKKYKTPKKNINSFEIPWLWNFMKSVLEIRRKKRRTLTDISFHFPPR